MTIAGIAVDRRGAGDQAVRRRALDQLLARAPALLRGEHQRSVLDEGCPGRRGRPSSRERSGGLGHAVSRPRPGGRRRASGRGGSDRVEVVPRLLAGAGRRSVGRGAGRARVAGDEDREQLAVVDGVADRDLEAANDAVDLGRDLVLHLHRLEHDERLAGADQLIGSPRDRDHGARERGVQREVGHARRTLRDDVAHCREDLLGRGVVAGVGRHVRPGDVAVGLDDQ